MKEPQLNPQVADLAPTGPELTVYDEEHWSEVCRIVLRIDPPEVDRARLAFESHLSRARWMTEQG